MKIGTVINRERDRLVENLRKLQAEKQKAQALISELNPLIDAARLDLQAFDDDVALIPARIKSAVE